MGILLRIEAAQQEVAQREAAQQAIAKGLAKQRAKKAEEQIAQTKAVQDRIKLDQVVIPTYIQDTEAIIQVATALPKVDYDQYLKKVAAFMGCDFRVGIYAHPEPELDSKHPLAEKVKELARQRNSAFAEARINPRGTNTLSRYKSYWDGIYEGDVRGYFPYTAFFGAGGPHGEGKPSVSVSEKYGFLNLFTRTKVLVLDEPQSPGIGINFSRYNYNSHSNIRRIEDGCYGSVTTETYDDIYLRISPRLDTLITNSIGQQRFKLVNLQTLDNALELAFQHPIHRVEARFDPDSISSGD